MPENTRAWYFTPEEKAFAVKRMQLEGRKGRQPYTRAKFKKVCRDDIRIGGVPC
jgi:ACS family pantothenate transporter-like MFS transporter